MHDTDTVLVVEDDPAVRLTIGKMLKASGIDSEPAASATEAIDRVRRGMLPGDPARIALALIDLRLGPGESGGELISKLRGIDRQLQLLIVTGFLDDASEHPDVDVVSKPFREGIPSRDLILKARHALDKRCIRIQNTETHTMMCEVHRLVTDEDKGMKATRLLAETTAKKGLGDLVMEAVRQPLVWGLLLVCGSLISFQVKAFLDRVEQVERKVGP